MFLRFLLILPSSIRVIYEELLVLSVIITLLFEEFSIEQQQKNEKQHQAFKYKESIIALIKLENKKSTASKSKIFFLATITRRTAYTTQFTTKAYIVIAYRTSDDNITHTSYRLIIAVHPVPVPVPVRSL